MSLLARSGQIRRFGAEGLYVHALWALSRLEVTVDGVEPVPSATSLAEGRATSSTAVCCLTPGDGPASSLPGGGRLAWRGWWRASPSVVPATAREFTYRSPWPATSPPSLR